MGSGVNPITGATVGALLSGKSKHTQVGGAIIGGAVGLMGSALHDIETRAQQTQMNAYQQKAMTVGRPRLSHEEIQTLTGKGDGDTVARSLIVFAKAGDALNVQLVPYFIAPPVTIASLPRNPARLKQLAWNGAELASGFLLLGSIVPLSDPKTVPAETWPALYVMWAVLGAISLGLFIRRMRKRP
jgi:hypothetical protein